MSLDVATLRGLDFITPTLFSLVVVALYLGYDFYKDGRAIGTTSRPDLDTHRGHWLIGNLVEAITTSDHQLEYWYKWAVKNKVEGNVKRPSMSLPWMRIIDISHPVMIEHVQKTAFHKYNKGPLFVNGMKQIFGEGIFAVDGHKHVVQRKATSKIFSTNNFNGIISDCIQADLGKLKSVIAKHAESGTPFDLSALFFSFTLSSFTKMSFAVDIPLEGKPVPFAAAFDYAQTVISRRFTNPLWRITEVLNGEASKMRAARRVLDDFAYKIIDSRAQELLDSPAASTKSPDLLSLYMQVRDDNGEPMSRTALRDAVLNLIIAGRDTTAQALMWETFYLLSNPQLLEPLRTEIEALGPVAYENFKSYKHCHAAFNEALRKSPSVPKNIWIAVEDDIIPGPDGPVVIHKGDSVRWSDWAMGRDESVWGNDALEYKPARWLDDKNDLRKETAYKFHVFNAGPRLCLGQNLANFEGIAVMATILAEFDLEFAPDYLKTTEMVEIAGEAPSPRYSDSLTLPMFAPLMVVARRRA